MSSLLAEKVASTALARHMPNSIEGQQLRQGRMNAKQIAPALPDMSREQRQNLSQGLKNINNNANNQLNAVESKTVKTVDATAQKIDKLNTKAADRAAKAQANAQKYTQRMADFSGSNQSTNPISKMKNSYYNARANQAVNRAQQLKNTDPVHDTLNARIDRATSKANSARSKIQQQSGQAQSNFIVGMTGQTKPTAAPKIPTVKSPPAPSASAAPKAFKLSKGVKIGAGVAAGAAALGAGALAINHYRKKKQEERQQQNMY